MSNADLEPNIPVLQGDRERHGALRERSGGGLG